MASVAFTGTLHIHGIAPGDYSLRTVGMRSRFHDDLLGEFTLAAEQTLDLGTITIPAPVVPALVARTTTGRAIAAATRRSSSSPSGAGKPRFDGVSKIGPRRTKSAPSSAW